MFIFRKSKKEPFIILLVLYGVIFFLFLHYYYSLPKSFRKFQQAIYTLLEFCFFSYIIWYSIRNKKLQRVVSISTILFICFHVSYFVISKPQKLDSIPIGVETIIILFLAFLYFQQFFKYNLNNNIYEYPSFWLVVGIIIYLGSSFFFNMLVNHISQEQFEKYWHYTYIPEILKNILFGFVIWGVFFKNIVMKDSKQVKEVPYLDMI